jgi:hypothetical protein
MINAEVANNPSRARNPIPDCSRARIRTDMVFWVTLPRKGDDFCLLMESAWNLVMALITQILWHLNARKC